MLDISPKAINKSIRIKKPLERFESRTKDKEIDLDNIDTESVFESQHTIAHDKNSVDNLHTMQVIKAMRLQKKPSAGVNSNDKSHLLLTVGPKPLEATLRLSKKETVLDNILQAEGQAIPQSAHCGTPEGKELTVINEPIVKLEPTL